MVKFFMDTNNGGYNFNQTEDEEDIAHCDYFDFQLRFICAKPP